MSVIVQQSQQLDQPGILRRRVTGTPAEIDATVSLLKHSGTLVSASVPRQVGADDRRVTVIVRVRENVPAESPAPRPAPARPWVKPLVVVSAIGTVLAGLIIGGYLAAQQVIAATSGAGLAALGFLVVVLGLVLAVKSAGRKGVCVGLHCSGCGHR